MTPKLETIRCLLAVQKRLGLAGRIFFVSGWHIAEIVRAKLASSDLHDGDLFVVNGYLKSPGLTAAVCTFMTSHELEPVALADATLILARGDSARYRDTFPHDETITMFGAPCKVMRQISTKEFLARTALWRAIRATWLVRLVRRLVHA